MSKKKLVRTQYRPKNGSYLSGEYTIDQFISLLREWGKEAQERGVYDVTVSFESTYEPYEDYLGSPEVFISGERCETDIEMEQRLSREKDARQAEELGLTVYEYSQYKMLKAKGVI